MIRTCLLAALAIGAPSAGYAATIVVNTSGSAAMSFTPQSITTGLFPFGDVGISINAKIAPVELSTTLGGHTTFSTPTLPAPGALFTPGVSHLDLGYTPAWTGSVTSGVGAAIGGSVGYDIGPFHDSSSLFNSGLGASGTADITAALQTGVAGGATYNDASQAYSLTKGFSATEGPCPFCVTVASVTATVNASARASETATWAPAATYGDLVWYSTSASLTPADSPLLVMGSGGAIANTFGNPAAFLNLHDNETIYMNILPLVKLNMAVTSQSEAAVAAALTFEAKVFGLGVSKTFDLGDIFNAGSGLETLDANGAWLGSDTFSLQLIVTHICANLVCQDRYHTPGVDEMVIGTNDTYPDAPPSNGFALNLPDTVGGYGSGPPAGRLFPNGLCDPNDPTSCITGVSRISGSQSGSVPEPAAWSLLIAGFGLMGSRLRRRSVVA